MEDNYGDSMNDTAQSEAESMDYADYWNDIASDAEADGNALESIYGSDDDCADIDQYDSGDDW